MPNERHRNILGRPGEWMSDHRRAVYVIFLALAGLNGWASWKMFCSYPLFAIPNAVMAAILVLWVISTWRE